MEFNNKFNINDLVFIFAKGNIIHCKVKSINVDINKDGCKIRYIIEVH